MGNSFRQCRYSILAVFSGRILNRYPLKGATTSPLGLLSYTFRYWHRFAIYEIRCFIWRICSFVSKREQYFNIEATFNIMLAPNLYEDNRWKSRCNYSRVVIGWSPLLLLVKRIKLKSGFLGLVAIHLSIFVLIGIITFFY